MRPMLNFNRRPMEERDHILSPTGPPNCAQIFSRETTRDFLARFVQKFKHICTMTSKFSTARILSMMAQNISSLFVMVHRQHCHDPSTTKMEAQIPMVSNYPEIDLLCSIFF
mmetsp:Transcript_38504/g.61530  ORF Transcript_38504/g.61530 Transcript_38504/m.61530 type:complete len:112 (+) Transcript_38504:561-896(+)